jgi:hypothetical protein
MRLSSALLWCVALAASLLCAGDALAQRTDLIKGESKVLKGEVSITFWTEPAGKNDRRYTVLPAGVDPSELLRDATIDAPPGWKVEPEKVTVGLERASTSGRRNTTKFEQYVIRGTWKVTVPDDCPPGEHHIRLRFPAAMEQKEKLNAVEPTSTPEVNLNVRTFNTAEERDATERQETIIGMVLMFVCGGICLAVFVGVVVLMVFLGRRRRTYRPGPPGERGRGPERGPDRNPYR